MSERFAGSIPNDLTSHQKQKATHGEQLVEEEA